MLNSAALARASVALLAFVVLFGYGAARAAIDSLFLSVHGSEALPYAWCAVALVAGLAVVAFNAAARTVAVSRLFLGATFISCLSLVLLGGLAHARVPYSAFALYVWKDVHIVVLLESIWCIANLAFEDRTAKVSYGLFCAAGSLGGIAGGLSAVFVAPRQGTLSVLVLPVVAFVIAGALGVLVGRLYEAVLRPRPARKDAPRTGFGLLRTSRVIPWLLALVVTVQLVVTLVDYEYSRVLEAAYRVEDDRTAVMGQVNSAVDAISFVLQLATVPLLMWLGGRAVLFVVPALLGISMLGFAIWPVFAAGAVAKIASKALDYSLFKSGKELLYIPLSYEEKTQGKAIVDMLGYRVAKGGASIVVLGLIATEIGGAAMFGALALVVAWIAITAVVTRRAADAQRSSAPRE